MSPCLFFEGTNKRERSSVDASLGDSDDDSRPMGRFKCRRGEACEREHGGGGADVVSTGDGCRVNFFCRDLDQTREGVREHSFLADLWNWSLLIKSGEFGSLLFHS